MHERKFLAAILVGYIGGDSVCLRKNGRLGESRHGSACRYNCTFLPRDAILARYLLSSCVRLSVRLSVTSRYCSETTGQLELVFGTEASFHLYHTVL